MDEKWKESGDSCGAFGALMTDLSKTFDCLHHELLIAKLDAYGFDIKSVKLIQQHLSNRKQRVKVSNAYSSWKVPEGRQEFRRQAFFLKKKTYCNILLMIVNYK